jgi:cytochrome b subunit of formate dehydrogenase
MHAATDPRSSVHPNNKASTCIAEDCHDAATPALTSFDVHGSRDMHTHTLQFGVALFFVLMTLAILLPILTLNVLGLIRELFPSHKAERELHYLVKRAHRKAANEGGIQRFTGLQRLQHLFLITVFVVLCLTGFPMKFPETSWAPVIYQWFGGITMAPIIHRIAGVSLLLGFALHVVGLMFNVTVDVRTREERPTFKAWLKGFLSLPMIPNLQDWKDLVAMTKYVFFLSPRRPHYGRFCWKEKLEYLGLFWGITLLGITGILLWSESLSSHLMPGWVLNVCYLAHTYESFLAVAHITLVHIPGIIGRPGVSPISAMVLNGKISPRAQAEEHGAEVLKWAKVKGATT